MATLQTMAMGLKGASGLPGRLASTDAWRSARERAPKRVWDFVRGRAEECLRAGVPAPMGERFHVEFAQTGVSEGYARAHHERIAAIGYLTAAHMGGLMDGCVAGLAARMEALCRETTWVHPAVTQGRVPVRDESVVDICAAMTAGTLAMGLMALGGQLSDGLRQRVRMELDARMVRPFLLGEHWWLGRMPGRRLNNWTPVCCAGALLASVGRPEADAVAQVTMDVMPGYLETFSPDGGCEEGPSYWVYGMDAFVLCAEVLGDDRLYRMPMVKEAARYPGRVMVGPEAWLTYSDARTTPRWSVGALAVLAQRTGADEVGRLARSHVPDVGFMAAEGTLLQNLLWWPEAGDAGELPVRAWDWFQGLEMGVARSKHVVATVRSGHNGQCHNHNDVGHVTYHLDAEPMLTDLGAPAYDRDYFSPKRCRYLVASSRGHSVPEINGHAQARGAEFKGRVIEAREGRVEMELAGAYPAGAGLESLVRKWVFDGATGRMDVMDAWRFGMGACGFASAWVTTARVEVSDGCVWLKGTRGKVKMVFDAGLVRAEVERHLGVRLTEGVVDVYRVVLRPMKDVREGRMAVRFEAEGNRTPSP